ncbi:MAG: Acetyl-CoA:oxalate CoA-transferase [Myxococcota bacterium]|nr:Acetyl-CoA:oxalate CoA-transferase [Myxococcota bacterium]
MSESIPPLHGLLVVDLTRVLAGPCCTMILRDLGARVIKIERPGGGDDARAFPPFIPGSNESAYFISVNRGKESAVINLKDERGRDLLIQLISRADVLAENFTPGCMDALGLGPEVLCARNPRLIYARLSGMGQTGPDSQSPAYDITIQARSGLASITGPDGGGPVKVGSAISDLAGGMYAAMAIMAAIIERQRSGKGQTLDIAMLDATISLLENAFARTSVGGEPPGRIGMRHPSITPFQAFRAADGEFVIAAGNDNLWRKLCEALEKPQLAGDPRFTGNPQRTANWRALQSELEAVLAAQPIAHWLALFRERGIPAEPIQNIPEVMADPQVRARGMVTPYTDPKTGVMLELAGSPFGFFSRTPGERPGQSPVLGEHTSAILREFCGLDDGQIRHLHAAGVVE